MVILEFRLVGKPRQFRAIDEAIHTTQFIRNKCVRYWQETRGTTPCDLNKYCAILERRRHNPEQGRGAAGTHYRGASRKVTLGESGASAFYGKPWEASTLDEPRIPRLQPCGVSKR
jgi:hypothetical protein